MSTTALQLQSLSPPIRVSDSPIATNGVYIAEAEMVVNPSDSSQLIWFFSNGNGLIRGVSNISTPLDITVNSTPVFLPAPTPAWDDFFVRKGSIWVEGTTLFMNYSAGSIAEGNNASYFQSMGIATSNDLGLTWNRYAGNPTMPYGAVPNTDNAELGYVVPYNGTYYMYYIVNYNNIDYPDPYREIRLATATSPYGPWTDIKSVSWLDLWEYHQVVLLDDGSVLMFYENPVYEPTGEHFVVDLAVSPSLTGQFVPFSGNPVLERSGGSYTHIEDAAPYDLYDQWDGAQVSTPSFFEIGGNLYLFYTGGNAVHQSRSTWQIGVAVFPPPPLTIFDATSAATAENITLVQSAGTFVLADASAGAVAENIVIILHGTLAISDSAAATISESITLIQSGGTLAVADSTSLTVAGNITITLTASGSGIRSPSGEPRIIRNIHGQEITFRGI